MDGPDTAGLLAGSVVGDAACLKFGEAAIVGCDRCGEEGKRAPTLAFRAQPVQTAKPVSQIQDCSL